MRRSIHLNWIFRDVKTKKNHIESLNDVDKDNCLR